MKYLRPQGSQKNFSLIPTALVVGDTTSAGFTGKYRTKDQRCDTDQDVPLMESEKINGGDLFPPATHIFNEASNPAPSRRPHDVTEFITMSNVSEEGMAEKKEEISFSQDLALLFVMEEQIWGRLSNTMERETSAGPEKCQSDPENCAGLSEKEIALNIQEANLEDIKDLPLSCHHGELTAAYSLGSHQPSVFNTTTVTSTTSEVKGGQVEIGFSQALDPYDTFPQTQCGETVRTDTFPAYECPSVTHGITKRHQNAESSKARSDEDHSRELEAQHEMDKRLLEGTWGTDKEMASKMEGSGSIQFNFSTKDDVEKVRELKGQREDVKSSAPFQSSSERSEDRTINAYVMQAQPNGILCLLPSKTGKDQSGMDEEVAEMGQNSFIYTVLHLKEEEQDDTGESKTHLLKETNQTKHAKNNTDCGEAEADQKELSKAMEPEMEALELVDNGH
ncbi:uncharacterized protein LOC134404315 [Elgaria multicarinata webbii]|uniref:uncharacterized protein LOC134404315 n=1 Tax=Elgaria multicarinata webbii TaxID=159646 RepID=UPI002FCD4DCE